MADSKEMLKVIIDALQDKKAEEDALALGRAAAVGTDDGKRPRNTEADDHHGL